MAGGLTISTLNDSSGVLATQNGMSGIAKAWVNFQGGSGNTAGTINNSFNVSSVTVNGTGNFTVNFTTAMPSSNFTALSACNFNGSNSGLTVGSQVSTQTTSSCIVYVNNTSNGSALASIYVSFACFR